MPPLIEEEDGKTVTHSKSEDQCNCLARKLLLVPTDSDNKATAPLLPFVPTKFCLTPQLSRADVQKLLRNMLRLRATVKGGVLNMLVKICQDVLAPDLTEFCKICLVSSLTTELTFNRPVNACFRLSYHPTLFKTATTIVLRKPSGPYSIPKNWRPIALLCPIGKLFESAITKAFTSIAEENDMIPSQQMAFTGRTTTTALVYIKEIIRAAWSVGKVASLLSLDMSGAFNRVNRARLLEILHEKGVPEPLIVLIQSFLSYRTTTIKIPGTTSHPYAVNNGIP